MDGKSSAFKLFEYPQKQQGRKKMRNRIIAICLTVMMLMGLVSWDAVGVFAADYEYAWFPAPVMNLTQLAYESYSHGQQNAIDISPGGTVFAPFTGKIVYMDSSWGYVVLQSTNKVYWADGTVEYMTVGFMHDENISDLYVGKTISQGQNFYHAGGMGDGDPNAYGDHVHITVHYGKVTRGYPYGNGDRYAFNAFYVNSSKTYGMSGRGEGYKVSGNTMLNGAPSDYRGLWVNLADAGKSYENLGDEFFAEIRHKASGYGIANVNGNVELGDEEASCWQFIRNSDNSYQIFSTLDGNAMDVAENKTDNYTNIQTYTPNTSTAQKWYIKAVGGGYSLISASSRKALDIANGSTAYGTNAWIYSANGSAAQILELDMNIDRTCTIQFCDQNGNVWMPDECDAGEVYTVPDIYPWSSKAYFSGWAYAQGAEIFDLRPGDTITVTENIALYPVFISHAEAISGKPVLIYNIGDFAADGYNITEADYEIKRQETTGYWTDWSSYSTTKVTASDTVEVKTTAMYRYYYYLCTTCGDHNPLAGRCGCGGYSNDFYYKWFTTPYSKSRYQTVSYATSKCVTTSLGDGQQWYFSSGNKNHTAIGTVDSDSSSVVITTGYSSRSYISQTQTKTQTVTAYVITDDHNYIYSVEKTPTVTQAGYLMGICYECHQVITVTLPALNSTDYTYAVKTEATCTADGTATYTYTAPADRTVYFDNSINQWGSVYVYTWSDDGEYSGSWPGVPMNYISDSILAYNVPDGADYIIFNNKNGAQTADLIIPTDGKNLHDGYGWSVYDHYYRFSFDVTLPQTGHSFNFKATQWPFNGSTGTLTGTCSQCQKTVALTLPPLNTTDYIYEVLVQPTCTSMGTSRYTWKDTTYGTFSFDYTVLKTDHTLDAIIVKPTETESGSIKGTCSACGWSVTADLPPLNTEDYTYEVKEAATCSANGIAIYTWKITKFGTYRFNVSIPSTEHTYKSYVTAPTCTQYGYTTVACKVCGDSDIVGYTDALDHSYQDGVCTRCGEADPNGCVFSGMVTSFGSADEAVTIQLYPKGSNTAAYTVSTKNGSFTMAGLTAGEYRISFSKQNHVTREYEVTLTGAETVLNAKIHLIGDIDGNGKVNVGDVSKLNSHLKGTNKMTDEYMLLCANVNGGSLNMGDTAALYGHIKATKKLY